MTGHKGNSEFCFPEKINVPRGEAEGNIEVEGKQNSLFPEGSVIKCLSILDTSLASHLCYQTKEFSHECEGKKVQELLFKFRRNFYKVPIVH